MKIALIACCKTKKEGIMKAKDIYISQLFKGYYNIAKKECDKIYILSARYGILNENDYISSYQETLNDKTEYEKKLYAYKIYQDLSKILNSNDIIYWYAGENYKKYLTKVIKNKQIHYSQNLRIGKILKKLKNESISSI